MSARTKARFHCEGPDMDTRIFPTSGMYVYMWGHAVLQQRCNIMTGSGRFYVGHTAHTVTSSVVLWMRNLLTCIVTYKTTGISNRPSPWLQDACDTIRIDARACLLLPRSFHRSQITSPNVDVGFTGVPYFDIACAMLIAGISKRSRRTVICPPAVSISGMKLFPTDRDEWA